MSRQMQGILRRTHIKKCANAIGHNCGYTLIALIFLVGGCSRDTIKSSKPTTEDILHGKSMTQSYNASLESKGVVSAKNNSRLMKISLGIEKQQKISDEDLEFWIDLLQSGPITNKNLNYLLFKSVVFGAMIGKKQLTSEQSEKLFRAVLPYTRDISTQSVKTFSDASKNEKLATGSQISAMYILASTRNPKALGVLQKLSQTSTHAETRKEAKNLHDKLQSILQGKE